MFFQDIVESLSTRLSLQQGSPKKHAFVVLSVIILLVWGADLLYWLANAGIVFSLRFLQTLANEYFIWFIVSWVAVLFSLPGYLKIRAKLLGIEEDADTTDSKKTSPKRKAQKKVQEEADELLDNIPVLRASNAALDNSVIDPELAGDDLADLAE